MGTETDRHFLLQSTFLAFEEVNGLKTFGYYRSKEGREFIRHLYEPYLRRIEHGDGKVASIISDTIANPDKQIQEVDRTKSALRRWRRDGQIEIWPKDSEKNFRCFQRLENEFIATDQLREVMSDNAETIQRVQSGHALCNFFYGPLSYGKTDVDVSYIQARLSGLYRIRKLHRETHTNFQEAARREIVAEVVEQVRQTSIIPDNIDISGLDGENQFWDTRESAGGYQEDNSSPNRYIRISSIQKQNFMLAQEFEVVIDGEQPRVRNVSTGYAFPLADNTLHILYATHGPNYRREYLGCTPDDSAYIYGSALQKGEWRGWLATRRPQTESWGVLLHSDVPEYWTKVKPGTFESTLFDIDKLSKKLDQIMWNL